MVRSLVDLVPEDVVLTFRTAMVLQGRIVGLDTWRVTSPSAPAVAKVAGLLGGTPSDGGLDLITKSSSVAITLDEDAITFLPNRTVRIVFRLAALPEVGRAIWGCGNRAFMREAMRIQGPLSSTGWLLEMVRKDLTGDRYLTKPHLTRDGVNPFDANPPPVKRAAFPVRAGDQYLADANR